jgi:hypothetical protein
MRSARSRRRERHHVVPPDVPTVAPGHVLLRAADDEEVLDRRAALRGLVGDLLQRHDLPAAPGPSAVISTLHSASWIRPASDPREAPEDDGVRRTEPRAGQHRDRQLGHHAEVDRHPVATTHAEGPQGVRGPAHLREQLGVGDRALLAVRLADPDVGDLAAAACGHVPVEAVHRCVQDTVREPR